MPAPRLAVFDVDGTLIDSQHTIIAAMSAAWDDLGLGLPRPEAVRRIIGLSLLEACAVLLPDHPPSTHQAVASAYKASFQRLRLHPDGHIPLFDGAGAALDALEAEGWLLGLATGKSRRGVDAMLDSHGFHGRFVTIQTADDNPSKPNPSMLRRAGAECGLGPDRVAMIGDTAYDMQMAVAAAVTAIGVAWGYHAPDELRQAGASQVLDTFDNLPRALDSAIGERPCVRPPC